MAVRRSILPGWRISLPDIVPIGGRVSIRHGGSRLLLFRKIALERRRQIACSLPGSVRLMVLLAFLFYIGDYVGGFLYFRRFGRASVAIWTSILPGWRNGFSNIVLIGGCNPVRHGGSMLLFFREVACERRRRIAFLTRWHG